MIDDPRRCLLLPFLGLLVFVVLETFKLFGIPIFWFWAILMNIIPAARQAHWIILKKKMNCPLFWFQWQRSSNGLVLWYKHDLYLHWWSSFSEYWLIIAWVIWVRDETIGTFDCYWINMESWEGKKPIICCNVYNGLTFIFEIY